MSILKLKDKNGNWVSVPTIKGDPGEQGVPGKDANVTKENIERALSFTPASEKSVADVESAKQDKLIAGENITISEDGKTISAIASMKHLYFEYEEFTIEDVCNLETGCYYFHEWIDVDQEGTKWEETGYYGFDGLCSVDVSDNQVWVACYDYGIWYTFFKDGKLKDCGDNFSATNPNYATGKYGIKYSSSEGLWIAEPNNSEITSRVNFKPITPARLDFAVKAALTDGKGAVAWSDTEKQAAREMIGAGGYESRISALESALIDVDTAISRLEQAL